MCAEKMAICICWILVLRVCLSSVWQTCDTNGLFSGCSSNILMLGGIVKEGRSRYLFCFHCFYFIFHCGPISSCDHSYYVSWRLKLSGWELWGLDRCHCRACSASWSSNYTGQRTLGNGSQGTYVDQVELLLRTWVPHCEKGWRWLHFIVDIWCNR